jgi:integrase
MSVIYGYAVRNDIIPTNLVSSFSDDPILRKPKPDETKMQSFVPLDKLGHLFYLVKSSQMSMPSKAFLFIDSYTALRVNSLIGAKWSDYDEAKSILNISADKMKNNRATQCPLPFQAKVLLGELKEIQQMLSGSAWDESMFIFSENGKKRINNDTPHHSMKRIINKHNFPHATVHGFRTICQIKWTQDKFISEAINIQLDHSVTGGSSVVDRYLANEAFLPERAKMTQHMADFISSEMELIRKSM